jgi:Cof subfamily protein (haloacid dehalogenase superfamily)
VKTLYISDLDGTLLDSRAALSEFAVEALNRMARAGLRFSAATARTWESTRVVLAPMLPLPAPAVLMNGALVYDTQAGAFVRQALLPEGDVLELLRHVKAHGQTGFLYSLREGCICPYHEPLERPVLRECHDTRVQYYGKRFAQTADLARHAGENIVYFTTQDSYENLEPLYRELQSMPEIGCELYTDSYRPGNWYLECFSRSASKYNAVMFLREQYGYEKVVGFGDNLNDLPLFAACDEAYAVANAREEVKAAATGVIGANVDDGVVKFLLEAMS